MGRSFVLITHPNAVIDRDVPVADWPLSSLGIQRMHAGLRQPWVPGISAVYCSTGGDVAIVAHGAVGTLLYCHLAGLPIDQCHDQPGAGGGHWYGFSVEPRAVSGSWRPLEVDGVHRSRT